MLGREQARERGGGELLVGELGRKDFAAAHQPQDDVADLHEIADSHLRRAHGAAAGESDRSCGAEILDLEIVAAAGELRVRPFDARNDDVTRRIRADQRTVFGNHEAPPAALTGETHDLVTTRRGRGGFGRPRRADHRTFTLHRFAGGRPRPPMRRGDKRLVGVGSGTRGARRLWRPSHDDRLVARSGLLDGTGAGRLR